MIIKLSSVEHKTKIVKCTHEKKQLTYRGMTIKFTGDLSQETLQARGEWSDIFQILKAKYFAPG